MEKVKAKCIIVHISIIKGHPLTLRKTNTAALTDGLTTMITLFSQPLILKFFCQWLGKKIYV